jgi:ATP-binding cassette subfamily B protein
MPIIEILTAGALALVVVFGGKMALGQSIEIGVLVAFALYIQRFFEPVRRLTMQYTAVQRAVTSASRVFDLMDTPPEVQDRQDAIELPRISGEVRYEDVSFRYTDDTEVLHDIDLHIRPGEHMALVGATGSGKTTMASLLLRLYDVTDGRIVVDGHDIRDVQHASLARQMSIVLQEPFLFSGTIADNIRYAHTEVPDEDVERVARIVGAHGFISRMEKGYQAEVEERGQNLSPGQRQLIALARALVADPRIVILDEATASVDSYTERQIQRALERLLEGRTAIIIAHRLSTVRDADRIVVMEQGRIVEQG